MQSLKARFLILVLLAFFGAVAPASAETLLTTQTPERATRRDSNYEKGLAFYSVSPGQITAVRFWKAYRESGTHVGKIWSNQGALLASVTFTNETSSGWQQQSLPSPLTIAANTTYIVSVNTTNGRYVYTDDGLESQLSNGDLRSVVGNNGRWGSSGQYPANDADGTNYFRDVVFVAAASVSSVALSPASLTGGNPSIGTVTLNGPAPVGGAVVTLSSNNAAAVVPASVTVGAGSTTGTFPINTSSVGAATSASISATCNGSISTTLAINPPALASILLDPPSVTGGAALTGTAILDGPAPAGGVVVALSGSNPMVPGIQGVHSPADLPQNGFIDWGSVGPLFSPLPSSTVSIAGMPGSTASIVTAAGTPPLILDNCSTGGNCGWWGNFASGASILWTNGVYNDSNGFWVANGPLTVTFSSPQHGLGFHIMADEVGPFTATLCAYDSSNALLGCMPFSGNSTMIADGSAVFVGLYDDLAEISKVTVDAGGALFPHDFAIDRLYVASTRRQMLPATVTVPAGATGATFPVSTSSVPSTAIVNITGVYVVSRSASLAIQPPVLADVSLNPDSLTGGTAASGTATLTGPAPVGGVVVALSGDNPDFNGIQGVHSPAELPQDGSIEWSSPAPLYGQVSSGTALPIAGLDGVTATISTATGLPGMTLDNCSGGNCGWYGNFAPGHRLLWVGSTYNGSGWTGNGPLTITFNSPQHGLGFHIMADELGPFTATLCAYDSSNALLGCVPFTGNGSIAANGSAIFAGLYSDAAEIAKVTVDAGGVLYPHDFAIGCLYVANSPRQLVPASVTVPAGASSATFPVTSNSVNSSVWVPITASYGNSQAATLEIHP